MVVNGHRQFLLRLFLADHVAVQKCLDLRRTRQPLARWAGLFALLIFQNLLANGDAFVADVRPRKLRRRADQFFHLLLRLMAERAAQRFFWREALHWFGCLPSSGFSLKERTCLSFYAPLGLPNCPTSVLLL